MGTVTLCAFAADDSVRTMVLNSVAVLTTAGSGELPSVGRRRNDIGCDRDLIAMRLGNVERVDAVARARRLKRSCPATVDPRWIKLEPMSPSDDPRMLFP